MPGWVKLVWLFQLVNVLPFVCVTVLRTMLPNSTTPAYILPNFYYFLPRCLLRPTLRRLLASAIDLCIVAMWFLACNLQPHQAGEPIQVSVSLVAKVDLNHPRASNSFAFATSFSHFYLCEMAQRFATANLYSLRKWVLWI